MKLIRKICLIILIIIGCFFIGYAIGKHFESIKMKKNVNVDFISEEIETEQENIYKYQFLPAELSDYIVRMCTELEIDSDLAVAILSSSYQFFGRKNCSKEKGCKTWKETCKKN